MDGILIVDKPKGITSFGVVDLIRQRLGTRKVGHSGTLDPIATGVLVILLGKATKLFSKFVNFDKTYEATLHFGIATDTGDGDGQIIQQLSFSHITREKVNEVLEKFKGKIEQIPPMVSALRYKGDRLYELSRKGVIVPRKARQIQIYKLQLLRFDLPEIDFYLRCSKGTYVRTLGEDIAKALDCVAHISKIRRTELGPFRIEEAVTLDRIDECHIRHWQYQA